MKINELSPGDLLQFVSNTGPIPYPPNGSGDRVDYFGGEKVQTAKFFSWVWEEGHVPRHMIYIGRKRENGAVIYEMLWNDRARSMSGASIKHLERVAGSEDIQVDGRACTAH